MILTRGDTGAYKFTRINAAGEPITEAPDALYFTVKRSFSYSDFVLQKSMEDMTLDNDGTWHFVIEPEDTATLDYGDYVYDIEVTVSDYVKTISKGKFSITEEATWAANK